VFKTAFKDFSSNIADVLSPNGAGDEATPTFQKSEPRDVVVEKP